MSKLKLLVVDDETAFTEFVAEVSKGLGFDVVTTDNPSEFATLYQPDFNIIVLDILCQI